MKRFRCLFTRKGGDNAEGVQNLLKLRILQWLAKRNDLARAKSRHIKSKNWN